MSDEIRPDPKNARRHPDANKTLIRRSLEEVGGFRSIGVDGDGIIRAGNGVYEQAKALGMKIRIIEAGRDELIAVKRSDLHGEQAERAAILDNRTGELAEWEPEVLAWLKENEPSVIEGIWDAKEWRGLLATITEPPKSAEDTEPRIDAAEELRAKWGVDPDQLWEIPSASTKGRFHRLLCGDSTNPEQVKRLMNGKRAVLFATDPPYLVDYTGDDHPGGGKDWTGHYFDKDQAVQGDGLYDGFISAALAEAISDNAAWYCWHASRKQVMVEQTWEKHGAFVHQQIVWKKNRPILTYSWYMWQHEPCFFGWVKGKKPKRTNDEFLSTIWEIPSPTGDDRVEHPTQKPVEVFIIPILQHTDPGDLCYEPFSGSGTQLVAAESTGRICYAIELSPAFVAVALERLSQLGLEPRLVK